MATSAGPIASGTSATFGTACSTPNATKVTTSQPALNAAKAMRMR
jgi:hypothetical protein